MGVYFDDPKEFTYSSCPENRQGHSANSYKLNLPSTRLFEIQQTCVCLGRPCVLNYEASAGYAVFAGMQAPNRPK